MTPSKSEFPYDLPVEDMNAPHKNITGLPPASGGDDPPEPTKWEKKREERKQQNARFQRACSGMALKRIREDADSLASRWRTGKSMCEILGDTEPYENPQDAQRKALNTYGYQSLDAVAGQMGISWEDAYFSVRLFKYCDQTTIAEMYEASIAAGQNLFPLRELAELLQDQEGDDFYFRQVISSVIQSGKPLKFSRRRTALFDNEVKSNRPVDKAQRKLSHSIRKCDTLNTSLDAALEAIEVVHGASEQSPKDYKNALAVAADLADKAEETIEKLVLVRDAVDNLALDDEYSIEELKAEDDAQQ